MKAEKTAIMITFIVFSILSALPAGADLYTLDPAHTTVGFAVKHMVIAKVRGTFDQYTGEFTLDDDSRLVGATAEISVESVNTRIEKRDAHLRSEDFFFAEKYPTMTFRLLSAEKGPDNRYTVTGDLTMRGVTRKVTLEGEILGPIQDPSGNRRAGFNASGMINRKEFGLMWNKVLETGGLVVGNEVELILEGEGILKK